MAAHGYMAVLLGDIDTFYVTHSSGQHGQYFVQEQSDHVIIFQYPIVAIGGIIGTCVGSVSVYLCISVINFPLYERPKQVSVVCEMRQWQYQSIINYRNILMNESQIVLDQFSFSMFMIILIMIPLYSKGGRERGTVIMIYHLQVIFGGESCQNLSEGYLTVFAVLSYILCFIASLQLVRGGGGETDEL